MGDDKFYRNYYNMMKRMDMEEGDQIRKKELAGLEEAVTNDDKEDLLF